MAEAVITAIATTIAGDVTSYLVAQALEKVGGLWGVKHEIEVFRDKVSALAALLEDADAEEQYYQSHYVKDWVQKLKDAFYDAQDMLEELNIEAVRRELRGHNEISREVRTFFSRSNQLAFKLKMSNQIRAVRKRIEDIDKEKTFALNPHSKKERGKREETFSFIREGDIKGRENDKETVMEFLLNSNTKENVSILPIVGIGGLGKTALAQFVYNDERVSKHFDLKMWVCVSDGFDMEKIVRKTLACVKGKEPTEVAMEQLQNKLREAIDGKRYLLVLDDVWIIDPETPTKELDKWLKLKTLLMGGARGSKILITTRFPLIAEITDTASPHHLRGLSDKSSLDLLMQMARRKVEEIQDREMLAIAEDIVKKCTGVPLVIRTVGSLLFFKKTKFEWLHFKDNELPEVFQQEDHIKSILRLSYDYLPSHLKQCFAFCSLFPKDYEMNKQTLVNLWMAEGFIRSSTSCQHLEDIAHEYFMDLLGRNFFQDYKQDPFTNKETCKMHDLMHDLACLVAGTECWVAWDDPIKTNARTRHISYDSILILIVKLPFSHLKACALRTFLSTSRGWGMIGEADIHKLIQASKRLRILDLHSISIKKMPKSICKLKHLTYLDLSCNYKLKRLPNSMKRLQSLQTLILNRCFALEELPRGIRKLVSLQILDIDGCNKLSYMPRGLGQLTSLHRLERFILPKDKALAKDYCKLGELSGLNNIRGSLRIENLGYETDPKAEMEAVSLGEKKSLKSLELWWTDCHPSNVEIRVRDEALLDGLRPHSNLQKLTISRYGGERFPRWMMDSLMSSCPNLVELHFLLCERCKHLPPLGQLPDLKHLEIWEMTELEYIMEPNPSAPLTSSFPCLLNLDIVGCGNLKALPPIPNVLTLKIYECGKLKALPPTPHLEELLMSGGNNKEVINHMLGLCKLRTLEIMEMELPECLPEECLKSLNSLESLKIDECRGLTSLSRGMRHLSNLVELDIKYCSELDICKDESGSILDFHGLPRLRSLKIKHLPKLESLPLWLLQLSTLECLSISNCYNLKELPEEIVVLHSLQRLEIISCPLLTSLPEGMRRWKSHTLLRIHDCPNLKKLGEENSDPSSSDSVLVAFGS